jgi:hypothetical protein
MTMEKRRDDDKVEPLFVALKDEDKGRAPPGRRTLAWKLFWAALVFLALLAMVLKQAF